MFILLYCWRFCCIVARKLCCCQAILFCCTMTNKWEELAHLLHTWYAIEWVQDVQLACVCHARRDPSCAWCARPTQLTWRTGLTIALWRCCQAPAWPRATQSSSPLVSTSMAHLSMILRTRYHALIQLWYTMFLACLRLWGLSLLGMWLLVWAHAAGPDYMELLSFSGSQISGSWVS